MSSDEPRPVHRPVLLDEVLLGSRPYRAWSSSTARSARGTRRGPGGRVGPTGRLIGLDRDPEMLALAEQATAGLAGHSGPGALQRRRAGCSTTLASTRSTASSRPRPFLRPAPIGHSRGFSFTTDGPLDMRFDSGPDQNLTAADLVNTFRPTSSPDCSLSTERNGMPPDGAVGSWRSGGSADRDDRPARRDRPQERPR